MSVPIASDHAGYELKEFVKEILRKMDIETIDMGCYSKESVDYPDFGKLVAQAVNDGEYEKGILICGTGIGMSMVANRFPRVRAALCHNHFTAVSSREHNNANILVMGERLISQETAEDIVKTWFNTDYSAGRHQRRLDKIDAISTTLSK
ncbi:MAG: ribose 5-phosphate isomerase B [Clostridiales bacterium]